MPGHRMSNWRDCNIWFYEMLFWECLSSHTSFATKNSFLDCCESFPFDKDSASVSKIINIFLCIDGISLLSVISKGQLQYLPLVPNDVSNKAIDRQFDEMLSEGIWFGCRRNIYHSNDFTNPVVLPPTVTGFAISIKLCVKMLRSLSVCSYALYPDIKQERNNLRIFIGLTWQAPFRIYFRFCICYCASLYSAMSH